MERFAALRRLALLDTPAEQAFDRLTRLAAKVLRAPVALLSLIDGDRSFFKSSMGLPAHWAAQRQMPFAHSVCQHVVGRNAPLVISDARAHPLVSDNKAVAELRIVAYLGIPLVTFDGHTLGTFAVIDTVPRDWDPDDVVTLGDLAASAMTEIERRAATDGRAHAEQRLHLMESAVGNAGAAVLIAEALEAEPSDPRIVFVNDAYTRLTGYALEEVVGRTCPFLDGLEVDRTLRDTIRSALANWKPARLEARLRRKDGSTFSAELSVLPIADCKGQNTHWLVVQRDISERVAAAQALRESEERFKNLADSIPQLAWMACPDGDIFWYNRRWYEYTGTDFDAMRGWGWQSVHDPAELPRVMTKFNAHLASGEPWEDTFPLRRHDGEYRWHLSRAMPIKDAEGRVELWVGTNTDITDRKQADEESRRREAEMRRLAMIAQRTDNAVILTDPNGLTEWVNEGFTRVFGYRLDEVVGRTPGAVLQGPDTNPETIALMSESIRGGLGFQVEVLNYAKSGRTYWVAVESQPIHDDQGRLTGFMAIESDITDRVRYEAMLKDSNQELEVRVAARTAELRAANEFMKALLDNVQDGIVACDPDGALTQFNRTTREFGGDVGDPPLLPPDKAIAADQWASHFDLYHADGRTAIDPADLPLLKALRGERVRNVEMVLVPKGGAPRTLLASGRAFYDGQGVKLGAVLSMSDITERKRAELELRQAHAELEQRVAARTHELEVAKEAAETANRAKSAFFSRMSHELRTPLNIILGFGQLLEFDNLSASQRESAEQIIKAGRHLLALINEVLDIARIEAGESGLLSPEALDVGTVVAEALAMIRPLADQAGVRLHPAPVVGGWTVRADLQRLKQVLLNLLSNAIKYNRRGGSVVVACEESAGETLRIGVADTGPGIAPDDLPRLFAPFDRLGAEQSGVEGTGLGLALSKGLVEVMGGAMGVASQVGQGTTFWFDLPKVDEADQPESSHDFHLDATAVDQSTGGAGTVLYVEDNPANFRLVERILTLRPGVRLLPALLGGLGLELARDHRPDLIFLDVHLPDIPGNEVLRRLREDPATRGIPVVVLSADATQRQIDRLLAAGAAKYLVKPLDVKEFLRIVDDTLSGKEA